MQMEHDTDCFIHEWMHFWSIWKVLCQLCLRVCNQKILCNLKLVWGFFGQFLTHNCLQLPSACSRCCKAFLRTGAVFSSEVCKTRSLVGGGVNFCWKFSFCRNHSAIFSGFPVSYPIYVCLCLTQTWAWLPTFLMLLHLSRLWKVVEGFSRAAGVYFGLCSSVTGSVRAQQSSKHFMENPRYSSSHPDALNRAGDREIHMYNLGGRFDAWTSYFTLEMSHFTCWKCLGLTKYVIVGLRRTKFRVHVRP